MELWGIVALSSGLGLGVGAGLARLASPRAALVLTGLSLALAVGLIVAGRLEQGWGGIGMVAVASVMVAPFAGGTLGGIGLVRLLRRR